MFQASTLGADLGPYEWNGNPFDYIAGILSLNPRNTGGNTNTTPPAASQYGRAYDQCVSAHNGDLYGDCDYLIPLYNTTPPPSSTPNATGTPKPPATTETWDQWLEKNKIPVMFGAAILAVILTKKR